MYITTFYSFKGGTGRSMAMVNVGAELARTGSRVLLVDFDLEAPSLMTFNLAGAQRKTRGVVDFVLEYLKTHTAPTVEQFLCESETFPNGGRMWIMPAGLRDANYQQRLLSIHWKELYEEHSGFLLFEDLKAQWKEYLNPDYVLIDSRTGHSEVMGICTRQLADAVCAVFLPNGQNLDGLVDVVEQVRTQKENSEGRAIRVHFVVSNVPYTDDERGTLERGLNKFRDALKLSNFDTTIHHNPHLSLLGQEVFVLKYPNSSLSEEYRGLADVIRSFNLEDRLSALQFLRDFGVAFHSDKYSADPAHLEQRLKDIAQKHAADPEITFWLARAKRQLGEIDEAEILLDQVIARGDASYEPYLERAGLRLRDRDHEQSAEVREDLLEALRLLGDSPDYRSVAFAVRSLVVEGNADWERVASMRALTALAPSAQVGLTKGLDTSDAGRLLSYYLLRNLPLRCSLAQRDEGAWRHQLSLACIRLTRFDEAASILCASDQGPDDLDQVNAFNMGMAVWGRDGAPVQEWFEHVLRLHDASTEADRDANYSQCLSISAWICGDRVSAREHLERARQVARGRPAMVFSAWHYLSMGPVDFVLDLDEMSEWFDGRRISPAFMQRQNGGTR